MISGVVLAGGKSSRFGSDKGLHPFRGKPLVMHALDILRPHCGELMISTNKPDAYAFTGISLVADVFPGCGPMAGIHSALSQSGGEILMAVGCDIPLLPSAIFGFMLERMGEHQVVMPVYNGFTETMCAIYHRSCLQEIEHALHEKTFRILDVVARMNTLYVGIDREPFCRPGMFRNINTLQDLPG